MDGETTTAQSIPEHPTTAGVIVGVDQLPPAIAPSIKRVTVAFNTIFGQFYGLWTSGVTGVATTPANSISVVSGGTPIYATPVPGIGYWTVAADGGIFNYGSAGFHGSTGNLHLNKPVVGIAHTQDQGGYWLVASDGGIFTLETRASSTPRGTSSSTNLSSVWRPPLRAGNRR